MNNVAWSRWAFDLIDMYQKKLEPEYPPVRMDTTKPNDMRYWSGTAPLRHVHWMLETMPNMVNPTDKGKFYRWLGFVQGVLMSFGIYSIDEMREHNRKD